MNSEMNHKLGRAAFDSKLKNYEIEQRAHLPYTKLSKIIHRVVEPTWKEKENLASVLGKSVKSLFPEDQTAGVT